MLSLRQLLEESRSIGELKEITQPVDWCEEMSGLNYLVAHRENAPVLWFQNIKDARYGSTPGFNLFWTGKERIAPNPRLPQGARSLVVRKPQHGRFFPMGHQVIQAAHFFAPVHGLRDLFQLSDGPGILQKLAQTQHHTLAAKVGLRTTIPIHVSLTTNSPL